MADIKSKLLIQQAETVKSLLCGWIPKRDATVHTLRVLADKLLTVHNKSCKLQVAGSSASIVGFAFTAVGFGFSFFTAGTSLIVASAAGAGFGAVGGVVNAFSSFREHRIQEETFDTAQKIIDRDQEAAEAVEKAWEKFVEEVQTCKRLMNAAYAVKVVWNTASTLNSVYKLGAGGFAKTAASEGGLRKFDKYLHVGGFAAGAVMLLLDIYSLLTNLKKIDAGRIGEKDKEPKAVKMLRELADKLEDDMHDKKEVIR